MGRAYPPLPRRIHVVGDSMRPSFEPGDRLLIVPAWRYRAGDVVAVRDPRLPVRVLVKCVERVGDDGSLTVAGENADASTDSRTFGPVPRRLVLGRAVYCYAPAPRVGRITRGGRRRRPR